MPQEFFNYSPGDIVVVLKGVPISGYATDSFITAAREEATFTKRTGADGMTTRTRSRNKSGSVTLRLENASPTNDRLSALHAVDESTGLGYGPLLIKDLNGNTLLKAANAWVTKPADFERGKEAGESEWIIECDRLEGNIGGSVR